MAEDLNVSPYYDDFDEDKSFHRLLFRPGRAVQARELTQMQTLLQNQISRFGQNIFIEGSVVVPGGIRVDTFYEYVKLDETDISTIIVGDTATGGTTGITAEVLQKVEVEGADPATIYVRYTGGGSGGGRFDDAETITISGTGSGNFTVASSGTGQGTKVDLDKGIYFTKGFFAVATTQSLIIEKYGVPSGTTEIGLTATESIVTSDDDSSLLDNAAGTSNANAPGADRLKNVLTLTNRADIEDTSGNISVDYFTIAIIKDAEIVQQFNRSQYNLLGDELARRTYDESGDYTVDPFIILVNEHDSDSTKLTLNIDPGLAYVKGYQIDKPIVSELDVDKALTTDTRANGKISTSFGNYIRTDEPVDLPHIDTFQQVNLLDDDNSTVLGTARVRAITKESSGAYYRFYLFEVDMGANSFEAVRFIDDGTLFNATLIGEDNAALSTDVAKLYDTANNNLLFPVPYDRVKDISDITARVMRMEHDTTDGSDQFTLDTGDANITWEDTSEWIVTRDDTGAVVTGSCTFGSTGAQTILVTVSGVTSTACTVVAYVDKTSATTNARAKTLTTVTDDVLTPEGDDSVLLTNFDIYALSAVKDVDDSDNDITDRYILDNGQRDNYYGEGKLILKSSATAPTGNVKVTYTYFEHSGTGAYFSVDSYDALVGANDYSYIPSHTLADGTVVRLADVFDFRSRRDDADADYTSTGAIFNEVPKINETIQGDIEYYLPRKDLIYLDSNGNFGSISGNPSLTPKFGSLPKNAMAIYTLSLNAGTLDNTDVELNFIENRRYTMRDIGRIEARVDRLEEWTTLSLLEAQTDTLEVLDNSGNNRFKSGFFVDNFNTHTYSNTSNVEYRAAIDRNLGELRPKHVEKNTKLYYQTTASDSSTSSGITRKGDMLMLSYTESEEVIQNQASSVVNVNPYGVVTGIGSIILSPETDEWRDVETETVPTNGNTSDNDQDLNQDRNANNWEWNWGGFFTEFTRSFDR